MKFNFKGNQLINNLVGSSLKEVDNNIMCKTVSLILIVYIILIVPYMLNYSTDLTNNIVSLSHNTLFNLLIYLIIALVAESNIQLALFMILAVSVSQTTIIKYEFNQYILDIIIKGQEKKKSNVIENLRTMSNPAPINASMLINPNFNPPKIVSPKVVSPKVASPKVESPKPIISKPVISQPINTSSPTPPNQIKKIENEYESFNNNDNNNFSYLE